MKVQCLNQLLLGSLPLSLQRPLPALLLAAQHTSSSVCGLLPWLSYL
jgi:hypothetical protein